MKKLLLITFAICCSAWAFGQNQHKLTIKGIVTDSVSTQPIGYATISVIDAKTKAAVKSGLTNDNGSFEITIASGKYQLALANLGYKGKQVAITDTTGTVDLGKLVISASTKQLDGVTINAVKPLMKREVDRISYDVQADPESKALSALDMMRKVPLLSVDASDNIKLKGNGNYKILINGRESAMVAKNPSDILKAMPATNVERIEVITTPPAKYDAEGLAGIINIITKKNADQGYNIGINGRMNSIYGPAINLNATFKQGKFGLSTFDGIGNQGNKNKVATSGDLQNFFAQQSTLMQNGTNAYGGTFNYQNAELSYEIDSLNLLTGSIEAFSNRHDSYTDRYSTLTNSSGGVEQHYYLNNPGNDSYLGIDAAINYQLGFAKQKDRLLTFSYKYDYSPNKQFRDNVFTERLNYSTTANPDFQQYNNSGNKAHTVQVDYAHPFKKVTVEAGAKAILRNNFSEYHLDQKDYTTGSYITNPTQTNNFNYQQNVYSLYNSYQVKLEQWTAKAGLRLEHTGIDADFSSAGSTAKQDYNNFIPSVSVQRNLKNSSINLGFTQRIQRPGIYQLNPFIDQSNPKFVTTGNPNLRPELNNSFELNYSNFTKTPINIGLSYAFSNNSIQNVTGLQINHVGTQTDTVTISSYQNLGSNNTLGLNLNTNLAIGKLINFSINAALSHVWLKGAYNGQAYKNDGYLGNAFANASYKMGKGYRFGIDAGYFSGDVQLQGSNSKYIYSSFLLAKEFLNKAATISLVCNNPFATFNTSTNTTTTNDFYQYGYYRNYYRTFAVRFNYKFGKLNSQIKKNQHGINNDDTKGGGQSAGGGGG